MDILYIGHSAFLLQGKKNILIDPFISQNPLAKLAIDELPAIDYILITHDHEDHLGDAVQIAKMYKSRVIAIHEIIKTYFENLKTNGIGMNIGGLFKNDDLDVFMTPALHSCYNGSPTGFVIKFMNKIIYHMGDTALFSDLKLISDKYSIDLLLIPIGGHYTMHIEDAVEAVKILKPKFVIPMHYNTWPIIKADPYYFKEAVNNAIVNILNPNETFLF